MTAPSLKERSVEPRQLATWLRANGWQLENNRQGHSATWKLSADDDEPYYVDMPLNPSFRDYHRRLGEIFATLALATGKPERQLVGEVREATFDVIRLRTTGSSIGAGRVPIDFGSRLFNSARDLIAAAACSASAPRPVYRSRRPKDVTDFLQRVRFAPPESGSFIITILSPVPPVVQLDMLEDEATPPPFERQSTLMLANAVLSVRRSAEAATLYGDGESLLRGSALGISANLCDALANFVDADENAELDLQFSWASTRPVPAETPRSVRLSADHAPFLREGARILRANSPEPDFELTGAVVKLESENAEEGGTAVVVAQIDEKTRKVRVPLAQDDYRIAIRCHESGDVIACEGELTRQGNTYTLSHAREVRILTDGE